MKKNFGRLAILIAAISKEMCCKCKHAKVCRLFSCPDTDKPECRSCIDVQYEKTYNPGAKNGTDK